MDQLLPFNYPQLSRDLYQAMYDSQGSAGILTIDRLSNEIVHLNDFKQKDITAIILNLCYFLFNGCQFRFEPSFGL
jgi:hypothetical protein